jgi:CBS domain-containing protein
MAGMFPDRHAFKPAPGSKVPAVSTIMTRHVVSVRWDASVEAVTALFLERGLHGAPVLGDDGKLCGFISLTDLVREHWVNGDTEETIPLRARARGGGTYELGPGFHAAQLARAIVADLMMPFAISIAESTPITMAAALMSCERVHRLPVVADDGSLVGILSAIDVMRWIAREDGYQVPEGTSRTFTPTA